VASKRILLIKHSSEKGEKGKRERKERKKKEVIKGDECRRIGAF
jgi:hypothetical protein